MGIVPAQSTRVHPEHSRLRPEGDNCDVVDNCQPVWPSVARAAEPAPAMASDFENGTYSVYSEGHSFRLCSAVPAAVRPKIAACARAQLPARCAPSSGRGLVPRKVAGSAEVRRTFSLVSFESVKQTNFQDLWPG